MLSDRLYVKEKYIIVTFRIFVFSLFLFLFAKTIITFYTNYSKVNVYFELIYLFARIF